ncbi:Uncharacterized protein TPAR_07005 [Tolypocladium paradoxum]|uniref:Ornithine cyclodeaminase n=1 Tax=Tolypocladium paradoxum TaxID=94208 RepID=A0A2S4KRH6_9HYPO|nr:Uncharacterized protein TPAR_07005 [Tolypocladium paradoxum]
MSFTVLSGPDIENVFNHLTSDEVAGLIKALEEALIQYSTQNEKQYQPHRSVVTRPGGQNSLFMPATTNQVIGVKIVGISPSRDPSALPPGTKPPPGLKSVLTLCDASGQAIGVLNAAELTAFRTALGSMLLYRLRQNTENIVVFGAGKQALWHIRLAVLLRAQDIRAITIVNRSIQRTEELVDTLTNSPGWPSHVNIKAFGSNDDLENLVVSADVIFCTTPSTRPLFPADILKSETGRSKTRFISAIGSYRLDMAEIDPELLKAVTDQSSVFSSQVWNGLVTVDTSEGCLEEAGELVKAGITASQMLEVGHIQHVLATSSSPDFGKWLKSGFVIYKSVGIGVMDLAIGQHLLQLASENGIGMSTQTF